MGGSTAHCRGCGRRARSSPWTSAAGQQSSLSVPRANQSDSRREDVFARGRNTLFHPAPHRKTKESAVAPECLLECLTAESSLTPLLRAEEKAKGHFQDPRKAGDSPPPNQTLPVLLCHLCFPSVLVHQFHPAKQEKSCQMPLCKYGVAKLLMRHLESA